MVTSKGAGIANIDGEGGRSQGGRDVGVPVATVDSGGSRGRTADGGRRGSGMEMARARTGATADGAGVASARGRGGLRMAGEGSRARLAEAWQRRAAEGRRRLRPQWKGRRTGVGVRVGAEAGGGGEQKGRG